MKLSKKFLFIVAGLLVLQTLSAQKRLHIVFSPQWHAQAQFAGYIVAQQLGFYEAEGLNVEIKYPSETQSSLDFMRDGKADLITNMLPNAIMLKANANMDIVNVMQTAQHASLCLARKPGRRAAHVDDFLDMRVGLWANGLACPAELMNRAQELHWKIIPFREGFNLLNYDMVDAVICMEYNEVLHMKYSGKDVSERSILRLCENGYDIPEDGVYCMNDFYKKNTKAVKAFIRASKKGWEWCRQHPEKAIDMVINEMRTEFIYSSTIVQLAGLKVILKKQEFTPGKVTYTLTREQYERTAGMLLEGHRIEKFPDYKSFIAK